MTKDAVIVHSCLTRFVSVFGLIYLPLFVIFIVVSCLVSLLSLFILVVHSFSSSTSDQSDPMKSIIMSFGLHVIIHLSSFSFISTISFSLFHFFFIRDCS